MAEKQYTWHKVAESVAGLAMDTNNIAVVEAGGKKICVTLYQQAWYGFAYKCPHASGIMALGFVDAGGNVVCPLHRYRFNIRNGRNVSGEGYYLKTYPVKLEAEGLFIGIEEKGLFGW